MTNPFNIVTNVSIEPKLAGQNDELISFPGIEVDVVGDLSGPPGRQISLTAQESSSLGYAFKEWIVEVSGIKLVSVAVGGFTSTIEDMCRPGALQTELSEAVYTDGQFFYEDEEGNRASDSGYYGAGSQRYWRHDTATGITGPFTCGQSENTGGGGNNPSQPPDDNDDGEFGGRPGGGQGVNPTSPNPTNTQ
jgi:hypothetical protein